MNSKRKLLISMLAIVFVLLAVVATVAIAFALTQQTITTTLNIGYVVEDIDGTASATYTIGGVTESLTAKKGNQVIGDTLVFHAGDTEDAGNLMFPEGQIPLSAQNDNIVIQYTYSNTGAKHYIASMSFDGNISADNMKVEYSIDGTTYSENRYAVVVPANTSNRSYWIKISINNKAKSARFTGNFRWLLSGCDPQADSYLSLTSVEMQSTGTAGSYKVSLAGTGSYVGEIVFPSSVNGDPVTTIAANWNLTQEQKNQVTSVYIPGSVTTIGDMAFQDYQNLQTVTFEQNEVGSAGVQNGTGLTTIGMYAFSCCGLNNLLIPKTVTSVGSCAFYGCLGLTKIFIPASVTSIENDAFYNCTGLTNIEVASENTTYQSIGNCIIITSTKELIIGCKTSIIPPDNSVEIIGASMFANRSDFVRLEIPKGVTTIKGGAFANCPNLTEIIIPASVTNIDSSSFDRCPKLEGIQVSASNTVYHSSGNCLIKTSSKELLLGCKTSIIPGDGSVTKILRGSFDYCIGLEKIIISNGVTTVADYAFNGCTGLKEIVIGSSVTSISKWAFDKCSGIESIEVLEGNTVYHSSGNCLIETSIKTLVLGCQNSVIPDDGSVTTLVYPAFVGRLGLVEIVIPDSVTTINSEAFRECADLKRVIIGSGVTRIGYTAFTGCNSLESVEFKNPNGWFYTSSSTATSGTTLSSTNLANPQTAAIYLKTTYCNKYWNRK